MEPDDNVDGLGTATTSSHYSHMVSFFKPSHDRRLDPNTRRTKKCSRRSGSPPASCTTITCTCLATPCRTRSGGDQFIASENPRPPCILTRTRARGPNCTPVAVGGIIQFSPDVLFTLGRRSDDSVAVTAALFDRLEDQERCTRTLNVVRLRIQHDARVPRPWTHPEKKHKEKTCRTRASGVARLHFSNTRLSLPPAVVAATRPVPPRAPPAGSSCATTSSRVLAAAHPVRARASRVASGAHELVAHRRARARGIRDEASRGLWGRECSWFKWKEVPRL